MDIIEKLKYHEKDTLDDWYDYSDKKTRKFEKELVKFADKNLEEIKQYCLSIVPTEYSSLSIVYEALTKYSTKYNDFIFEEIQRIVQLALEHKINPQYLSVLTDIEAEDIHSKSEEIYIKILDFLTYNLKVENGSELNIELLEVVYWFLYEFDDEDGFTESDTWEYRIVYLANNSDVNVKIKAHEVFEKSRYNKNLIKLSLFEKMKAKLKKSD